MANLEVLLIPTLLEPESKYITLVPPTVTLILPDSQVYLTLSPAVSWNSILPDVGTICMFLAIFYYTTDVSTPLEKDNVGPSPTDVVKPLGAAVPLGPIAPIGPLGPCGPIAPIPVGPIGPCGPISPLLPLGPAAPTGPMLPIGPIGPIGELPAVPLGPIGPCGPVGDEPAVPLGPIGP